MKRWTSYGVACSLLLAMIPAVFAGEPLQKKPILKQTAIGAAAGAAVGALSDRASLGKATATGAVVGAGTGVISQSQLLKHKGMVRNALEGAVIGTGASYATGRSKVKGAVVGAGAGAGYHLLKEYIDDKK